MKKKMLLKKSIYLGFATLERSKIHMCERYIRIYDNPISVKIPYYYIVCALMSFLSLYTQKRSTNSEMKDLPERCFFQSFQKKRNVLNYLP